MTGDPGWEGSAMNSEREADFSAVADKPFTDRPSTPCWASEQDAHPTPHVCPNRTRNRSGLCNRHEEELFGDG